MIRLLLILLLLAPVAFGQNRVGVSLVGGKSQTSMHGQADLRSINLELAHPLSPRTDILFVVAPMNLRQPRSWFGDQYGDGNEDVRAIGGFIFLRRRFGNSFYVEGGTGPMYAEKAVPASTSRFNFASQAGVGFVLRPHSRMPIVAGYRFQHISNGGYAPRNPGINVSSVVVGVQFRLGSAGTR